MTQDPRPSQEGVGTGVSDPSSHGAEGEHSAARRAAREGDSGAAAGGATAVTRSRRSRHPVVHVVREVLIIGATALLISFLIKTFLVQAFWIPSGSMESTLVYGDRVLVSKIQAGPMAVERGDIIVFEDPGGWLPPAPASDRGPVMETLHGIAKFVGVAPEGESNHLIKRVIGVGGDQVVCCDDDLRLTVNGEPLEETYLYAGDEASLENFDIVVPEDHYWMMGDHRSFSRDSRAHDDGSGTAGSVPADNVVGQAFVLVWPLDRFHAFSTPDEVFGSVPEPGSEVQSGG